MTIEGCEFEAMWQGILLELPRGGASVVDNTFHDLVPLLSDGTLYEPEGMFAFTYGEGNDVSELMAANGNSFYDFNGLAIAFGGGPDSIGIWIRGPNNNFTVENNVIGGVNRGIAVDERTAGAGCATGLVVRENAFSGNTTAIANAGPAVIAAAANWWGDATGPYHATTNPGATGDDVTDNVAYSPWLGSGADGAVDPGFQPESRLNLNSARPPPITTVGGSTRRGSM